MIEEAGGRIDCAAHFMIATHADEVGDLIGRHVRAAETGNHL